MAIYSINIERSSSGTLKFPAKNDEEAREIYDRLLGGDIYPDDLGYVDEQTEDSNVSYYELRDSHGRFVAD
jgi:hypothetical protein